VISEDKKRVLDLFSRGRKLYKLMQFEEAETYFSQALAVDPKDGPSKVYLARCKHYVESPPPEDWDGVFVMTSK
jgi:tetratricopeptide (TPR) repeat protein